ncbi:hypothetical protein M0813_01025 [Anaeramoeba flamelloides]|uniref:Uncharacterized protein n=2 Tax=Anaeramoeba flamelloides TaxID=1746091 RepID=A0ABQ8X0R5_9EUKA|nr:hypothetical protein M0813_01025 [Anaeramoeba flamelloides]
MEQKGKEKIGNMLLMKLIINIIIFFEKKINLYNNNINFYQESEIEDESLFKLSPQLIELSNLIDEISDRSEEFFTAGSTNKNESFMNSRTKFIEKRINAAKQWEMRCQFSALNRELPEWKTILMDTLGFKINLPQIISQYNKNLEKQYEKYRQNTDEYKKQRLIRKVKKIANKKRRKEEGRYLFKDDEDDENLKKNRKFSCRYECTTLYKTKLSRLIHEIIFHQRVPVSREKDIISKDLLLTKKKLYLVKNYLNKTLKNLQERIKKNDLMRDKLNFRKKNEALKTLLNYIVDFENTYKIKNKPRRSKTLIINPEEFNEDIEIFKEIDNDEEENVDGLIEENNQEKDLFKESELEEIEEIITNERKPLSHIHNDKVFRITFDKRLPSSFISNTLLFETERDKNK